MVGGTSVGSIFVRIGTDASGLVTGFQRAEREIERFGSRVFFLGSRMTAGVTLPIIGASMAIGKFGSEFDKAMTESLAIMDGITPKIRKDMEAVARSISESSKYSAKQAAEGFYHLASAGYSASEAMQLLPITTKFAQAGVMDLAKATEYLAGAQQSLGMRMEDPIENAKEMARISDVLTEANNRALGTIEDFAQAITNKAGAQLRIYNKTVEEGTAALMALASQNVKGRLAGQQLYMVMRDLARFSLANADSWKKYGISVYDAAGNMRNMGSIIVDVDKAMNKMSVVEQTKMWKSLGFTDRTRAAIQYFRGMGTEMKNYENALNKAAGATQRVADNQMKAFANQLQIVWNKIQNVGIELFNAFAPALLNVVIPAVERMIARFSNFAKWVSTWSDQTKALTLIFLGLAAAMGPVITIMGSQVLFLSALVGGFSAVGTSLRAMTNGVIIATKAWNDYAKAQGAVSLAQSFAWASGAATATKGVTASGAAAVGAAGVATTGALGPGAKAYLANWLKEHNAIRAAQRAVLTREASLAYGVADDAMLAGKAMTATEWGAGAVLTAQAASIKNMRVTSAEYRAELAKLVSASKESTGLLSKEAGKHGGILTGIIGSTLRIFAQLTPGLLLFVKGVSGPLLAVVGLARVFSDSWSQALETVWNTTMPTVNMLIGILHSLQKQVEPVIDAMFGDDTTSNVKEAIGTWDEWGQALSDAGTVGWEAIHGLLEQFNQLGVELRNAYIYIPLISEALEALGRTKISGNLRNEIQNALFPGSGALEAAWEIIKARTGAKSFPDLISLMSYDSASGQKQVDDSAKGARAAFDKQMADLYGAGSGLPYSGSTGGMPGGTPHQSTTALGGLPAPDTYTAGYLGAAYQAMGGKGGMTGSLAISNLPQLLSGFEKAGKMPEFMKEVNKVLYRLAKATPEDRQTAVMEVLKRFAAQDQPGEFPEGLQKPVRAAPVDRDLKSRQDYFSEYTTGQTRDLKNMAQAATDAAALFFAEFPDAAEIPLEMSERMWQDYKKFKDTLAPHEITGVVKVMDDLTESFWKQEQVIAELKAIAPYGWWGTMAEGMEGVDKKVKDLVKSFDDLGLNSIDQVLKLPTEFFQDNQEAIGELASYWGMLPEQFKATRPEITALIERFGALNEAGKLMGDSSKKYFTDLMIGLRDMSRDATARLQDAEGQLETFLGGQFANKQMKYLKQTWSNAFDDIQKKYMAMAREIAAIPIGPNQEIQTAAAWKLLESWKTTMQKVVEISVRQFRASWAQETGFTPRQQRTIAQLPYSTHDEYDPTTGEKITVVDQPEFDRLKAFIESWQRLTSRVQEALAAVGAFKELLSTLGFEKAAATIGAFLDGATGALSAVDTFIKAKKADDPVGMVTGIIQMGTAYAKTLQAPTKKERALGGAASGAMMGMGIGYMLGGPIGAGIGAAIGGVAGLVGGMMKKDPGWKQIMGRVGHDYGMAFMEGFEGISEDLAKKIEADAKKMFGGDWKSAEIFNLGAIMEDTGGVNTSNMDIWSEKMTDIFSMLATGKFTMEQATTAFDKGFTQIAQAVLDADQIASPAFLRMIQLTREFGMESKAVAEFISGQFTRAMTAWAKISAPLATVITGIAEARQELIDFNKELEGSGKYDSKTGEYGELGVEDQKRLDEINKRLETVKVNTADASKEAERLGRLLMAAFNGAVKSGMDFFEIMDALGPNLDTLIKLYKDLGITSDNAALSALMHFQELYGKNKELVEGVRALNEMTLALSNLGALSAETLADLEAQGLAMYDKMIAVGFTETETLMAMLPWLKNVFDAHKKLGIPIDENTQKLIDQANKLGLLEENDPTAILKQGFKDLIQAVQDLTNALLGIPKRIDSDVYVNTHRTDSGELPERSERGPEQAFGGSYWVTQPTMFLAGEAGPEYAMFSGSNQAMGNQWGGTGGGRPIEITVISQLDGRQVAKNQVQYIPYALGIAGK